MRASLSRGTTLVESLVAVVIIAVCAAPILSAVSTGQERMTEAQERLIVLQEVQSELDNQRSKARIGILSELLLQRELNLPTLSAPVFLDIDVSLAPGYVDLYRVAIIATWETGSSPVQLITYIRSPDV